MTTTATDLMKTNQVKLDAAKEYLQRRGLEPKVRVGVAQYKMSEVSVGMSKLQDILLNNRNYI